MNKISSPEYCRNFVRSKNYDLYLLHFFLPRDRRPLAIALMALHCELLFIPQKANDPMMKLIRLKWWHDEVMRLFEEQDSNRPSPILEMLAAQQLHRDDGFRQCLSSYFQSFQDFINGQESDTTAALYDLLCYLISNPKTKNRFIALLQYHDDMDEGVKLRAMRLWLKNTKLRLQNHSEQPAKFP